MSTVAAPPPPAPRAALLLRAARPPYLPTSVLPAVAGLLVALRADDVAWGLAPVMLLALVLVHLGTNLINEVEDFDRGVDTPETFENSGVFTQGQLDVGLGRRVARAFFAGAIVLSFVLAAVQGPAVLLYAGAGVLAGFLYTAGPRPLKYLGLGDPVIVLAMGPLLTQGAYTAITGDPFRAEAFWLGLMPGLTIEATLAGNNLGDAPGDARAGARTLPVRLGLGPGRGVYAGALVLGFLVPVALWASGLFGPWILLALLAAPVGASRLGQARRARLLGDEHLQSLAQRTAQVHLLGALLLAVGVALDGAL